MERPTIKSLIWKDIFLGLGLLFALGGPIPLVAFAGFGVNIFDRDAPVPPKNTRKYSNELESILIFTAMFTGIGSIVTLWRYHRAWCLAKRGVIVTGRIVDAGSFVYRGHRDITYAFEYEGRVIRTRVSVPAASELYKESNDVTLLVDEKNPNRNMLM